MDIVIHCEPRIPWQGPFAFKMREGLRKIGIEAAITNNRSRESDYAILLGTTCWRMVEASGRYLLVDRAAIGDPHYVQLVWDGHGRRGNHCVPANPSGRFARLGCVVHPWDDGGRRVILCGQTEPYSPHYERIEDWYAVVPDATHFRKHPAGSNPTQLPIARDWSDAGRVVTLNSSVGVESVLNGIPTVTMDEGALAWPVAGHMPHEVWTRDRSRWLEWLAWTQWSHDEIEDGEPIKHLFEDL